MLNPLVALSSTSIGTEVIAIVSFALGLAGMYAIHPVFSGKRSQGLISLQSATIDTLEADISQRDRQIAELRQDLVASRAEIASLQKQLDMLKEEVIQKANVDLLRREQEAALTGLTSKVHLVETKIDSLALQVGTLVQVSTQVVQQCLLDAPKKES